MGVRNLARSIKKCGVESVAMALGSLEGNSSAGKVINRWPYFLEWASMIRRMILI